MSSPIEIPHHKSVRVYKYPIPMEEAADVQILVGAEFLAVQEQYGQLCLWAKVDTAVRDFQVRRFYVVGTGHPFPTGAREYLGTVQFAAGDLVFHVFVD